MKEQGGARRAREAKFGGTYENERSRNIKKAAAKVMAVSGGVAEMLMALTVLSSLDQRCQRAD